MGREQKDNHKIWRLADVPEKRLTIVLWKKTGKNCKRNKERFTKSVMRPFIKVGCEII